MFDHLLEELIEAAKRDLKLSVGQPLDEQVGYLAKALARGGIYLDPDVLRGALVTRAQERSGTLRRWGH